MPQGLKQYYPEEERDFILQNYKKYPKPELLAMLNEKFNVEHTYPSLKFYFHKNGLRNGFDCKYKKGHISTSKGKKRSPEVRKKMEKYFWKKGHITWNTVEDKTVTVWQGVSGRKYKKIKINGEWMFYHIFLWEQAYGKIPEGKRILFIDGDSLNCELSNMKLVNIEDIATMNLRYHSVVNEDNREVIIDVIQIERKLREVNK